MFITTKKYDDSTVIIRRKADKKKFVAVRIIGLDKVTLETNKSNCFDILSGEIKFNDKECNIILLTKHTKICITTHIDMIKFFAIYIKFSHFAIQTIWNVNFLTNAIFFVCIKHFFRI